MFLERAVARRGSVRERHRRTAHGALMFLGGDAVVDEVRSFFRLVH
jgi:hypothetical protein